MKRNDWIQGRQYDPDTINKPWWVIMDLESKEYDKQYVEIMKRIVCGAKGVSVEQVKWEEIDPKEIQKTPKLKPKS